MMYYFYVFAVLCCTYTSALVHAKQIETYATPDVFIRLASHEDLEALLELDRVISHEYFKPLLLEYPEYNENINELEQLLAEDIKKDTYWLAECIAGERDHRLYSAQVGTVLVGFVVCHKQDESIVFIDLLMIDASYRGQGIGKLLIQAAIKAFPGASTSMLVVTDKNTLARAVYEKIGFSLMSEKPTFVLEKYSASRFLCYSMSIK